LAELLLATLLLATLLLATLLLATLLLATLLLAAGTLLCPRTLERLRLHCRPAGKRPPGHGLLITNDRLPDYIDPIYRHTGAKGIAAAPSSPAGLRSTAPWSTWRRPLPRPTTGLL
jgi:hypothetical protein